MNRAWDLSQTSFLVIEDNIHMRSILRSVLSGFGVRQIYEASDGADGLEIVLDRTPDFILVDWAMAPVSGADFIKILRSDKDKFISTIPVVVVSAHSQKATIVEAMKLGVHGFIAKPVSPAVLFDRIGDILQKQELHGRCKGVYGQAAATPKRSGTAAQGTKAAAASARVKKDPVSMALL
ncbi:response regulator [uncultured Roseibium sp.]|uniref:response regulator n=1 Tax=uncultured Roseibium sp. TaxID=1936171 RepID=UPI0025935B66|nr:response regulator [uncultured Roseibium sp.]